MPQQIGWSYQHCNWRNRDDDDEYYVAALDGVRLLPLSLSFLRQELNDVNPLLIKVVSFHRLATVSYWKEFNLRIPDGDQVYPVSFRAEIEDDAADQEECLIFYPTGIKTLETLPAMGSTNRWELLREEFPGWGVKAPAERIVSFLDNLDPAEAMYAKVTMTFRERKASIQGEVRGFTYDRRAAEKERFVVQILYPEGAK